MRVAVEIVFETHSISEDNERGIATGWLPGRLSPRGRELASALGARRRGWVEAVFTSDLRRAIETAEVAFGSANVPIHRDPRLRECNYGDLNGSKAELLPRTAHVTTPFPSGESYYDVVVRMADFLRELGDTWTGRRVVIIGHTATRLALDHLIDGVALASAVAAPFDWREGWHYLYGAPTRGTEC